MLEVVILLMTCLIKYVFQIKQDLNLSVFTLITGMNESKTLTKHIHVNVNVDLTEENISQSNGGIMINVYVNVKNMYVKEIMFGILLHVIVKMENI